MITCHKCSPLGHFAKNYPKRTLVITNEKIEKEPRQESPKYDAYTLDYNSEEEQP